MKKPIHRSSRAKASIMMFNGKLYKVTPLSKAALKKAKSEFTLSIVRH